MAFTGSFVVAFMAFLAIMNPLANLPVFLGLTAQETPEERRRIATRAVVLTFGIVTGFALGGKWIFEAFGITLPALRITGGVLVFLIGFHMVQGRSSTVTHGSTGHGSTGHGSAGKGAHDHGPHEHSPLDHSAAAHPSTPAHPSTSAPPAGPVSSVAVSPLAMPILAGPGTIATAMNLSAQEGWLGTAATLAAFAILCLSTWVVFRYGSAVTRVLGPSAMDIMTRLMGLILAVIGVQMLVAGLSAAFPGLAR